MSSRIARQLLEARLQWVAAPFLVTVLVLAAVGALSVCTLSSIRAFVGAESLWAKGEKEAAYHLARYAATGAEEDFTRYRERIAVPLGDRVARLALQQPDPDLAQAAAGLLAGRNHPDDIPGMIRLFRRFGDVGFMARAIQIWTRADQQIDALQGIAERMHAGVGNGTATPAELERWVEQTTAIDRRLTPLEDGFSATLGEASRSAQYLLASAYFVIAAVLVLIAVAVTRRVMRQAGELDRLRHESEERLSFAVRGSNSGIWDWNLVAGTVYYSPQLHEMLGLLPGSLAPRADALLELIHPEDLAGVRRALALHLRERQPYDVSFRVRRDSSGWRWVQSRGEAMRDAAGRPLRMAGSIIDIDERKKAEEKLTFLAQYDPLTGLSNRVRYLERLTRTLESGSGPDRLLAVLFVDLDRFKIVNDTLGHGAGDELLRQTAERLRSCVRADQDEICRLGGDEFALALPGIVDPEEAAGTAARVVEALARPFLVAGQDIYVSASVGVALYPRDGRDADTLLKHADSAMYRAKATGRNGHQFFAAEMLARTGDWLQREADLHRALQRGEYVLHYQPKIDFASGRICGIEALLRWRHPEQGLVPPGEFIPILEETGLIIPVGEWVIGEVCRQIGRWQSEGLPLVPVAVNVSARQFHSGVLDSALPRILKAAAVDPGLLEIELTESMLVDDSGAALRSLHRLKAAGVRLAVDDFGTGYSSLAYLKRFPIDALKIDRAFVRDVVKDPADAAIILAIINLAHGLGLKVIAEGIETQGQFDHLKRHGCDQGQGFLIARPTPAPQLRPWLESRVALTA